MAANPFVDEAGAAFRDELDGLGVDQDLDADAAELGRKAARAVAAELLWRRQLGDLLDINAVRRLLGGVSRQAVHQRRLRRTLLALRRDERSDPVYPAFQFTPAGVLPGLHAVLEAFDGAVESPWTVASWMTTAQDDLNGESPARVLRSGGEVARVVEAARRSAERRAW